MVYDVCLFQLRNIFNTTTSIETAYTKLAHWYKNVENKGFRTFNTIANTIALNYRSILNYFIKKVPMPRPNRSTQK
ncbi:transposase [uncultured Maribacter sp.]|uniref:transposase n=1 Tax=uncultured Maribacter sp. TaxID=431308 RepID=UPI0030DAED0C